MLGTASTADGDRRPARPRPPRPRPRSAAARSAAPSGVPVAKAPAAPTYSGSRARWPTSTREQAARVEAAGHQGQPGGGPRHHAGRPGERRAAPAARRARRRRSSSGGDPPCRRRTSAGERVEPGRRRRRPAGRARLGHDAPGGQHVQPGQHLPGRPRPQRRPARRARRRPAARPGRTGSVTVPARTSSRSYRVALQRGAGHRGPQADLGRDLAAVPAQRAVPQRRVDPLAGAVDGGGDVGEVEQRGERIAVTRSTRSRHRRRAARSARKWQDSSRSTEPRPAGAPDAAGAPSRPRRPSPGTGPLLAS